MHARTLLDVQGSPLQEDDQMGTVLVRLRPEVTRAEARVELERIFQQELARRRGDKTSGDDRWRRYFVGRTLDLLPAATGLHPPGGLRERFGRPLTLLTGAAVVVLLAACANVAGLVLARGVRRQREFAVRVAVGATRRRLAAQVVGETVLLSLAGGALGWWVAAAGTAALAKLIPEGHWTLDLRPDTVVFGFAALLTISAGLLCGLLPAWFASRVDLVAAIKASDGNHTGATGRFQQLLVITQIASSLVLIVVAGLFWARTFFGIHDPIGQRLKAGRDTLEIVGVAGDVNYEGPRDAPGFTFYEPYLPNSTETRQMFYTIRTRGEPAAVAADVRRVAQRLTPDARVSRLRTVEDIVDTALVRERAIMQLSGWFGAFTLGLAGLGVFGLLAFEVARRTREFGTRIALGAQLRDLVLLVMKRGLSLAAVGCLLGVLGGMAVQHLVSRLLVGTVSSQAGLFAAAIALLMVVAAIACWLPARRATKVDPLVALRSE